VSTLVMRPKRTAQMRGDPKESRRLIIPFLGYVGRAYRGNVRAACLAMGLDYRLVNHWTSDKSILPDRDQVIVRKALGDSGGAP